MKLLTFKKDNSYALGVKTDEGIIDVKKAVEVFPENGVATDMMELIEGGDEAVRRLEQFVKSLDYKGAGFVKKESILTKK